MTSPSRTADEDEVRLRVGDDELDDPDEGELDELDDEQLDVDSDEADYDPEEDPDTGPPASGETP